MLTVTKQAANEAEAKAILDASYLVRKPFGVPVIFVDPADYPVRTFCGFPLPRLGQKRRIEQKLAAAIAECDPAMPEPRKIIEDRGYFTLPRKKISDQILRTIKEHHLYGDSRLALAFPLTAPRISIVFHARIKDPLAEEIPEALGMERDRLPDLPGTDSQHHFISLWHEIAHSMSGDNEAGADLVSALAYRHAFADNSVLKFQGDLRAAHLILNHTNPVSTKTYGWSCVDAFDSVAALERPPTWDEVYQTGATSYNAVNNTRAETIEHVGQTLKKDFLKAFRSRNLMPLSDAAETMAGNGTFETEDAKMIAQRFALATRRLAQGITAY